MLSNSAAQDPGISYKARGVLGKMLSFDPGWVFHRSHLLKLSSNGRVSLTSSINELIAAGYLVKNEQKRGTKGRFANSDYEVYDQRPTSPTPDATEASNETAGPDKASFQILSDHRFVRIRNAAVRDPSTSDKAKGILLTMLSFPPDWRFSQAYLERFATDGEVSIGSGLAELMAAGYIARSAEQERDELGQFGAYIYTVADYRIGTEEDPLFQKADEDGISTVPPKPANGAVPRNPVPGKPVPRKPAHGEPTAKKTINKKTLPKNTLSSRPPALSESLRAEEPTTQGEKRKSLNGRILATFKNLHSNFLQEDPRRAKAWHGLDAAKQDAAFGAAQERKKNPHEPKAFSTVLKEELDLAAGLTRAAASTIDDEAKRARELHRTIAMEAQEMAFHNALDAGHDVETAEGLGIQAFKQKFAELSPHDFNATLDEPKPAAQENSADEAAPPTGANGLTGAVFQILSRHLVEIYRKNKQRMQAWNTLTPEQREQALSRVQADNKNQQDETAFVWALVAELDSATGLKGSPK